MPGACENHRCPQFEGDAASGNYSLYIQKAVPIGQYAEILSSYPTSVQVRQAHESSYRTHMYIVMPPGFSAPQGLTQLFFHPSTLACLTARIWK